jgi:hypothetical protein
MLITKPKNREKKRIFLFFAGKKAIFIDYLLLIIDYFSYEIRVYQRSSAVKISR